MRKGLDLTGKPFVFGLKCPRCNGPHIVSALGVQVEDDNGKSAEVEPTLALIKVDNSMMMYVRCLYCLTDFRLALVMGADPFVAN